MMRRILLGLLCALALLAAGSYGAWRWVTGRMDAGFAAWQQAVSAQGWTVQMGAIGHGGWPLAADLVLDDFSIAGGTANLPGGAGYTAKRLVVRLDLLAPTVALARPTGEQSVRVGPGKPLPFTAETFDITVPLVQDGPPTRAGLKAKTIRFAAPAAGLTIGLLQGQLDWRPAGAASHTTTFDLSAEAIALPPPPAPQTPLGGHIASATVDGTLSGTWPAAPENPKAAATAWRDSGGAIKLSHMALGWGPLGMTGTAAFKLDDELQPDAAAALRLVGIDETLAALAKAGVITPRAAQAAKAVAGLLAATSQSGGAPGVEIPVALHGGTVTLGMIPLATVGKLLWPDGS